MPPIQLGQLDLARRRQSGRSQHESAATGRGHGEDYPGLLRTARPPEPVGKHLWWKGGRRAATEVRSVTCLC